LKRRLPLGWLAWNAQVVLKALVLRKLDGAAWVQASCTPTPCDEEWETEAAPIGARIGDSTRAPKAFTL